MPTLLLIRHGENDYTKSHKMAGRLPGVHLNEKGQKQAQALGEALKGVPLKAVYASPLERAMETASPIAESHKLKIIQQPELMDTDIGDWQGRSWRVLGLTKAWKIVQNAPSRFRFPDGESFIETQTRCADALEKIIQKHNKPKDIVAVVFHADPIRLSVAHFLGMPLDHFQRLSCDTGSVTVIHAGESRATLVKMNQRPPFDFLPKEKKK
ncbi:MAG TPA: histidine phosphatase family protein [Anaerolineales bacterium]|jgi:probable phosphomutase (TIGR03848 family)|nr:histidine phosphatase family protein [Anaerolineales bacterium]HQX16452.1 histidine phosphatase family protein [Anaerolineales bacterium]